MKSCLRLGMVGVCLVAILLPVSWPTAVNPAEAQTNLMVNPGFEGGFQVQGASEISVGNGWTAWWIQGGASQTADGFLVRPEYKGEDSTIFGSLRVRSGRYSQKFFSTYSTHDAGLFQVVAVPAGVTVRFSVWVQVWSSSEDDPENIVGPGNYFVSVGIDPSGATNPTGPAVVWSQPALAENRWVELAVTTRAHAGQVAVFLRGAPQYRVKHNDSYWDDASLVAVGEAPEIPPPAPQPSPETPSEVGSYVVQPGDTLTNIALRYGTTIQALMALNDLQNANFIWVGQRLLIRGEPQEASSEPSPGTGRYTVQPGDTLASIARRFGTTVATLVTLNNIANPERIYVGQSLVLPSGSEQTLPAEEGQGAAGLVYHVVQPGETLLSIAARYGVSIWSIAQANNLADVNLIWAGLRLVIPS
jgi:LysM repeat protein